MYWNGKIAAKNENKNGVKILRNRFILFQKANKNVLFKSLIEG